MKTDNNLQSNDVNRLFNEIMFQNLIPISLGLSFLFFLFTILHLHFLPPYIAPSLATLATISGIIIGVCHIALYKNMIPANKAPLVGTATALIVLSYHLYHLYVLQLPRESIYIPMFILGIGYVLLISEWFFGLLLLATVFWTFIAIHAWWTNEWQYHFFAIGASSFFAIAIHVSRRRYILRIFALQCQLRQKLNEKESLIGELQSTKDKIRTLKGLLPICSSCKNIRDNQGDWHILERYLGDHSEAEFTHGICPDCTKKFYSEIEL